MVNLVMTGADGVGGVWQDPVQLIPLGMYDDPVDFVARLKAGLPLVNNLRILFNEHSFNADGSLHPQMEAFFAAAAAQGFDLTICYGEGDAQNIGIGEGRWPDLTNAEAMAALTANYADVAGAWTRMLDWMEEHPVVAEAVYGWELMNESAGYRHAIRNNSAGDGLTATDFVRLFADHSIALSDLVQARMPGRVLVGGWGYNGDFLTLANTRFDGQSAIDYLRAGVGDALVWSAHLYPGWMGTNLVTSPAGLVARLQEVFAPVAEDAVLITEINADGQVNDPATPQSYEDFFTASYEWFAERGIGFGWYPGVQTGASHLLYLEGNGVETIRHQHSLGHALNAFSLGHPLAASTEGEALSVATMAVKLRNEPYEIAAGEADFDVARLAGFAFGHAGNDTLTGTDDSTDYLYGGRDADVLAGLGADDFLYGQWGDDRLDGAEGQDNLFGGWGRDVLTGGAGRDYLVGGAQDDTYIVTDTLDTVIEYQAEGRDRVLTTLSRFGLMANVEDLVFQGTGNFSGTGSATGNLLSGASGRDSLIGLGGGDTLIGGGGADVLDGGAGFDVASYETATAGVMADLASRVTGSAAGDAAGDRYLAVEGLRGSGHADRLAGNAGANTLWGLAGNDTLTGRGGADRLIGGAGADRFVFAKGAGADQVIDFQDGRDRLVFQGFDGVDTARDLLALARQAGGDVVIALGAGDSVTLKGVALGDLSGDIVIL